MPAVSTSDTVTVSDALAHSLNTVSVRLLYEVGMRNSLDFLRERLHMDGLVAPADGTAGDLTVSSLALGQQSRGVTLRLSPAILGAAS